MVNVPAFQKHKVLKTCKEPLANLFEENKFSPSFDIQMDSNKFWIVG